MNGLEHITLNTPRLRLRLLRESDGAELCALLDDAAVTLPAGFAPPTGREAQRNLMYELLHNTSSVAVLRGDVIIGYIHAYRFQPEGCERDGGSFICIGFALGRAYWRNGYGAEAVSAFTRYLLTCYEHCYASCFPDNEASQRTLRKCGFRLRGRGEMYFSCFARNMAVENYSLSRNELGAVTAAGTRPAVL